MGKQSATIGWGGENAAVAFLLSHLFQDCKWSQPGSEIDITCTGIQEEWNSQIVYRGYYNLPFHFQIKTRTTDRKEGVSIGPETFEKWLRLFETQPVFVLYIKEAKPPKEADYWFLVCHDWLIENAHTLSSGRRRVTFKIQRDFVQVNDDRSNFLEALHKEAGRAKQAGDSPWATLRDYGLLPFDERQFLAYMEFAPFIELPKKVLSEITKGLTTEVPRVVDDLLRCETSENAIVQQWWDEVKLRRGDVVEVPGTSFEREQFRLFVNVIRNSLSIPTLPPFHVSTVQCWRTFVIMYPQALHVLERVIAASKRENDVVFAAALLGAVCNADDNALRNRAFDVLRHLEERIDAFPSYRYRREVRKNLAEAGKTRYLKQAVSFIEKASRQEEAEYLIRYGWGPEGALRANILRKLSEPTRRDVNIEPFYEALAEKLLI